MGIGVEETQFEDLLEEDPRAGHGDVGRVGSEGTDPLQIVDRDAVDELHGDHARGRELLEDRRDVRRRVAGKLDAAALHGPAFGGEIELAFQGAFELASQAGGPVGCQYRQPALQEVRQVLDDIHVGLHDLDDLRPPDLQGDGASVPEDRPMDLRDRRGRHRNRVDRREDFRRRLPVLLAQDLLDLVKRERTDVVAQAGQLVDVRLREQVRPGAQQLSQLHERRPQVLADQPEPTCTVLRRDAFPQRHPLDRPHQALEVQGRDHILIAVPHQGGQNLPVTWQVAEMSDRFSNHAARPSPAVRVLHTPSSRGPD